MESPGDLVVSVRCVDDKGVGGHRSIRIRLDKKPSSAGDRIQEVSTLRYASCM